MDELTAGVLSRTGRETRRGNRPGIDHRIRCPVGAPLDCLERIERQPGGVHAELFAHGIRAQDLLDTGILRKKLDETEQRRLIAEYVADVKDAR